MKPSILYLDDDTACLTVFRDMFSGNYDVRIASTHAEARAQLAERPADIIISDQHMPEMEGMEFLREVAAAYPQSFRIMLTGELMIGHVINEVSTGVVHLFTTKPFDEPAIQEMLERASFERYKRGVSS
ncbi:MAG: response regulator [Pyrinomonadaceae bacterium]